ncbi:ParB N-terminal domain-containing protein [Paracoccus sulfuroxidans]|uniref:ParB-like nuclease family protein n=1 Tax=Paracoccus sulfuroxidans TaxID=384678 RepID=A0A562NS79_9RHOB|nr:ParB N-terminal domain-containing protein [Paracoccus sulfuroxidans]TWI34911.1 ParB-like nuclease family protein [Paracoccus sulfuroxidans]
MNGFRVVDISDLPACEPRPQPAPQLMWIAVDHLVIDERYQRPLAAGNKLAIRRIAEEFQWSRFSPVLVAPVAGGRYALIDGQHRAHAAALCGFDSIPAMVTLVAPEEQALAFIEINTRQIRVGREQVYRAALAAGESWAIACRDVVEAAGCRLMTSKYSTSQKRPGMVFAVALIQRLVAAGKGEAVTRALAALMEYDASSVPNFSNDLLTPWISAVAESDAEVSALVAALRHRRPWLVMDVADRFATVEHKPKAQCRREAFSALIASQIRAEAQA